MFLLLFILNLSLSLLPYTHSWANPALKLPSTADTTAILTGYVQNNCPFPITVTSCCCYATCTSPPITLPPNGGQYWNPLRSSANACSQTIKVSRTGAFTAPASIYQIEYNVNEKGELWYNLSSVDGDPLAM
ncbi:hypothetical protein K491DRAFT_678800 [Lophiostoma macrostomum CBS 122681]|uniref:Uncharacterized protein n=1 Tax=Lophiostoma macrostomum CBS 122681 TaxID=1314788 RepID=A0A6A6T631_9PLEO|nr:hypothetical protein K491DRAFT_678800 [Lophiostoma macrostomum CBS 122681]